jgi:hypothetical protein
LAPGIDVNLFRPYTEAFLDYPRPILLYVGRVAVEKNIEAFLRLDTQGTKVVVGDGPQLAALRSTYPGVVFAGVHVRVRSWRGTTPLPTFWVFQARRTLSA